MDGVMSYLERIPTGVSDDGTQHLSIEMIASIHSLSLEWTGVMKRIAMAYEHFCRVAKGNLPTEDESSEEEDDTDSDDESNSD